MALAQARRGDAHELALGLQLVDRAHENAFEFALKMMGDIQEYFVRNRIQNFYSVSISGPPTTTNRMVVAGSSSAGTPM